MIKPVKKRGFWTKKRKDVPRIYLLLAVAILVALATRGWYSAALLAAIALGAAIAFFLHRSRHGEL